MAQTHRAIHHYRIENPTGTNCWNARIQYEGSSEWKEVSVLRYISLDEAETQKALSLAIGTIMANPLSVVEECDPSDEYRFLLFVERLHPLIDEQNNVWIYEKGKFFIAKDMWRIVKGVCLGFSDHFRNIVQQIALGLLEIHSRGRRCHGRPGSQVLYGADGKVRLCDLKLDAHFNLQNVKKDFKSFRLLLLQLIRLLPLGDDKEPLGLKYAGHHVPYDVKYYLDLIDKVCKLLSDHTKWLYNPPAIWSANEKGIFVTIMSRLMKKYYDFADACFDLSEIGGTEWELELQGKADPSSILWEAYQQNARNPYFSYSWGSVVFARNLLYHCNLGTVTFDELEVVFPQLISLVYWDLSEATIKGIYAGEKKKFILVGTCKWVSLDNYFWIEHSIFRSYTVKMDERWTPDVVTGK